MSDGVFSSSGIIQSIDVPETLITTYFTAALFSLVFCLFVILSYFQIPALKHHPSPLLLWRTIFDTLFALQFVILFGIFHTDRELLFTPTTGDDIGGPACKWLGPWFQFTVLGSQSWYFMMTLDLGIALLYPFSDLKSKVKYYHIFVIIMSAGSVAIIAGADKFDWRPTYKFCWIKKLHSDALTANAYTWALFFAPTILYYFASILVTGYAALKFRKGLRATVKIRKQVVSEGILYNIAFCFYWTVAAVFYGYTYQNKSERNVALSIVFAIIAGGLGVVDAFVWFITHRRIFKKWVKGKRIGRRDRSEEPINKALRQEILYYTTTGMFQSLEKARIKPMPELPRRGNVLYARGLRGDKTTPSVCRLDLPSQVSEYEVIPFVSYCPQVFRYMRSIFGIDSQSYSRSIAGDPAGMLEKFKQGRSNAFIYFTEDSRFIVKTLEKSEAQHLLKILPDYVYYMYKHPNSLINRFLGLHRIKMYHTTVYFIVMESVFLTDKRIHEKYDIKGSWVDRHTEDSRIRTRRKGFQTGTMKDSDLHKTILLSVGTRRTFLKQLKRDSEFLCGLGIMDYSLLIGIRYIRQRRSPTVDFGRILGSPMTFDEHQQLNLIHTSSRSMSSVQTVPPNGTSINESESVLIHDANSSVTDHNDQISPKNAPSEENGRSPPQPLPPASANDWKEVDPQTTTGTALSSNGTYEPPSIDGENPNPDVINDNKPKNKQSTNPNPWVKGTYRRKQRSMTEPALNYRSDRGRNDLCTLEQLRKRKAKRPSLQRRPSFALYSEVGGAPRAPFNRVKDPSVELQSYSDEVFSHGSTREMSSELRESLLEKTSAGSTRTKTSHTTHRPILIGIRQGNDPSSSVLRREPSKFHVDNGGVNSVAIEGPGTYYFGIIDILQEYNFAKKFERFVKVCLLRKDPKGISVINEYDYQRRFFKNIEGIVEDVSGAAGSVDYGQGHRGPKWSLEGFKYNNNLHFEEKIDS